MTDPADINANPPEPMDDYQSIEVSFIRKRDGQAMKVNLLEIFRQLRTADFTNNEITLNGEVCRLNSFSKPSLSANLSINLLNVLGTGAYQLDATIYRQNRVFAVPLNASKTIRIAPDPDSYIDSIHDSNGTSHVPDRNGNIIIAITADLTLTISFKRSMP